MSLTNIFYDDIFTNILFWLSPTEISKLSQVSKQLLIIIQKFKQNNWKINNTDNIYHSFQINTINEIVKDYQKNNITYNMVISPNNFGKVIVLSTMVNLAKLGLKFFVLISPSDFNFWLEEVKKYYLEIFNEDPNKSEILFYNSIVENHYLTLNNNISILRKLELAKILFISIDNFLQKTLYDYNFLYLLNWKGFCIDQANVKTDKRKINTIFNRYQNENIHLSMIFLTSEKNYKININNQKLQQINNKYIY